MKKLFIFGLVVAILAACGNDPVTTAGYFDDDVDKSNTTTDNSTATGVQNFNNTGNGNMEVNIYNTQLPQTTVINTYEPITSNTDDIITSQENSPTEIGITSIKFELINGYLYGTNLLDESYRIKGAYRGNHPGNLTMSFEPYLTDSDYIAYKLDCVTITSLSFYKGNSLITTWTGSYTVCDM